MHNKNVPQTCGAFLLLFEKGNFYHYVFVSVPCWVIELLRFLGGFLGSFFC